MESVGPRQQVGYDLKTCVDRAFNFLGESTKRSLFWHLENQSGLDEEELIGQPEELKRGLERIFGPCSKLLEEKISSQIRHEFKIRELSNRMDFAGLKKFANKQSQRQ